LLSEDDIALVGEVRAGLQQTVEPGRTVWTVVFSAEPDSGSGARTYAYGTVYFDARVTEGDHTCGLQHTAVDSLSLFDIDYEGEPPNESVVDVLDEIVVTADLFSAVPE
jgi:hypothetical protein